MTRFVAVLAGLLMLASCGEKSNDDGDGKASDGNFLDDRTLVVTRVTDDGAPHALVPGTQLRFSFHDGDEVGVQTGCNSMGGTYALDGTTLTLSAMSMTEMGCPEPQMKQEQWLAELLANPVSVATDPITFTIGAVVFDLADREDVSPDRPLAGTHWRVDGLIAGDAVSSVPNGVDAWLEIGDDGKVTAYTGCNQASGTVTVGNGTLTFSPLATTRKLCKFADNGGQQVEQTMVQVLQGETSYEIVEQSLTITNGDAGLNFRAD